MSPFGFAVQPLGVKRSDPLHRPTRALLCLENKMCEELGVAATTFKTRPMARCKRRHFVEEEQLRVEAAPYIALAILNSSTQQIHCRDAQRRPVNVRLAA